MKTKPTRRSGCRRARSANLNSRHAKTTSDRAPSSGRGRSSVSDGEVRKLLDKQHSLLVQWVHNFMHLPVRRATSATSLGESAEPPILISGGTASGVPGAMDARLLLWNEAPRARGLETRRTAAGLISGTPLLDLPSM